jgi:hypothetical protein
MVLVSALLMLVVSALTPKPGPATIARYFPTPPRGESSGAKDSYARG